MSRTSLMRRVAAGALAVIAFSLASPAAGAHAEAPPAAEREKVSLQLGSFRAWENATALRDALEALGENTYVDEATLRGKPMYRVRVGTFVSYLDAADAIRRLRDLGYDPIVVVGTRFAEPAPPVTAAP